MGASATDILTDIDLAIDLIAKIIANITEAKALLSTDQLSDAKARLATIQQQGNALDIAFDAALAVAPATS